MVHVYRDSKYRRGSALIAVMWFSAALSAIAFSLSMTVRTELDRASLNVDATRAYFLAQGAIEIAAKRILDGGRQKEKFGEKNFLTGQRSIVIVLPGGRAKVEITGDSGKLDIRNVRPEVLAKLLVASGAEVDRAISVAQEVVRLRRLSPQDVRAAENFFSPPSSLSLSQASFQQLEEILAVPGITPELFYGGFIDDGNGDLVHVEGLFHQFTMRSSGPINVNYASPTIFKAAGWTPEEINSILAMRSVRPILRQEFANLAARAQGFSMSSGRREYRFTLWSTAQLSNGQTRRTVGAKIIRPEYPRTPLPFGFQTVRWFDAPI